ncbi:hypothetical protein A2U01_0069109, partial [Trifolium medium]|nr:hypothetical protein [Trifolium medium]
SQWRAAPNCGKLLVKLLYPARGAVSVARGAGL